MSYWIVGNSSWLNGFTAKAFFKYGENSGRRIRCIDIDQVSWVENYHDSIPITYYKKEILKLPSIVLPRIGSYIWKHEIPFLRYLEENNVVLLNSSNSILNSVNKFTTYQLLKSKNIPFPKSIYLKENVIDIIEKEEFKYPLLCKSIFASGGKNQFLVNSKDELLQLFYKIIGLNTKYLLQEFIQASFGKSIRIVVFNSEIIGSNFMFAKQGDYRTNFKNGASIRRISNLSKGLADMAIKATNTLGLMLSSVDILISEKNQYLISEINSSPGLETIDPLCFPTILEKIFIALEDKIC